MSSKMLLGIGAAVLVASFAVPKMFASEPEDENGPANFVPVTADTIAALRAAGKLPPDPNAPVETHASDVADVADEPVEAPPPPPRIATSADGDVELLLEMRWPEYDAGERVLARTRYVNHSLGAVYLPAEGEPNQGLVIVIEDAEGTEVRRVTETGRSGQLPRKLHKLASADDVAMFVAVVAETDAPLPPGTYSATAELRPDTRLARLGVPFWTAPKGPVRSQPVRFVVKPPAER